MLRFLLIIAIITYIFYKVGTFLFKLGEASQQLRNNQSGNIKQNGQADKSKKKPKISGEYIDYEEVK
jgi:hypothetical protein